MKKFFIQLAYGFTLKNTYWILAFILANVGGSFGFIDWEVVGFLTPVLAVYFFIYPILEDADKKGIPKKYKY